MTAKSEDTIYFVHYNESHGDGSFPLMRIVSSDETQAIQQCLKNLADIYGIEHSSIEDEKLTGLNNEKVCIEGIYQATSEQADAVRAVFNL